MCGKFRAKKEWGRIVDPLDANRIEREGDDPLAAVDPSEDDIVTYRVMNNLPVILWDPVGAFRRVVPMRWGFPHPSDWKRPQPIHARAETIETTRAFADAFLDGQRGIVLMRSFNEAPDIEGPPIQHIITPGEDAALAAAMVWRRFDAGGSPLFACVLVTVPANALIATLPTDRMPAFLAPPDWRRWLSEDGASVDEVKACLKTVPGVTWTMSREKIHETVKRAKPSVSDPGGLF